MTKKQQETIKKLKKSLMNMKRKGYDEVKFISNNKKEYQRGIEDTLRCDICKQSKPIKRICLDCESEFKNKIK